MSVIDAACKYSCSRWLLLHVDSKQDKPVYSYNTENVLMIDPSCEETPVFVMERRKEKSDTCDEGNISTWGSVRASSSEM